MDIHKNAPVDQTRAKEVNQIPYKDTKWLDKTVSFYPNGHRDTTTGKALTLRDILLTEFIYYFPTLLQIKELDKYDPEYKTKSKTLKSQLGAYALNLMESRRGAVKQHSGLLQLDFDYDQIQDYDIDELMQAIYDLPFIVFCAKSCSGNGFYAFAMIAEPEKLKQYAEHCFIVLDKYGIPVDTSKGRNYNDLRYVSYDCNMMIKPDEDIKPLKVKKFYTKSVPTKTTTYTTPATGTDLRIVKGLSEIANSLPGNRWATVRKVAYTLGGIPGTTIDQIKEVITNSTQFAGYEDHCIQCAIDSFQAGRKNPIL